MFDTEAHRSIPPSFYGHTMMTAQLAVYRRALEHEIDTLRGLEPGARERILKAADEYAFARARERYAAISEMPELYGEEGS